MVLAWSLQTSWVPLVIPGVVLVPQFFPDGQLLSPRWRFLPLLTWSGIAMLIAGGGVGDYEVLPGVRNPFRAEVPWIDSLLVLPLGIILVAAVLTIATLVLRARRGTPTERQQLRVLLAAAVIWPVALVPAAIWNSIFFQGIAFLGLLALPAAIALGILRYRLYDIDLLINRTLVYGAVTATLAVTFFGGLVAVQTLLRPITAGSELGVAISTLASFALFQPVRRAVQRAVDRRFNRRRYDAERTLDSFSVRLRDEVDLEAVRAELLDAVAGTVQPVSASVWLRERAR